MFFLYFCYTKKNYVIVEVKKKMMSLIMKEMLIVSSI